jgi:DNA processing protein
MELTDKQRKWLALSLVPGVGTTLFIRLLSRFGTPGGVLHAPEAALREVVGPKTAERIVQYRDVTDVEAQIAAMREYGAGLLTMDDPEYPPLLAEIYDPPLVLYHRGALTEADNHCIAIVGTRKASAYGIRMAEMLAGQLAARGITIVSGMAAGVDAAAHAGALDAGGRSIAVLGCGVDIVYPAENAELMHRLIQSGSAVSCFPMGQTPSRGCFPFRNRIISGLSLGTLVIEAPPGSGAMITAKHASDQGREVFALPGQAGQRNSLGPHALIRQGAKLVETLEDILTEIEVPAEISMPEKPQPAAPKEETVPEQADLTEYAAVQRQPAERKTANTQAAKAVPEQAPAAPAPERAAADDREKSILSALAPDGSFVDEIAAKCRISVSEALAALTMLELKGLVRQFSGKRFAPR